MDQPPPSGPLHPAQFGALFAAHSRVLWSIAVSVTGDRTAAEDLVQEAAAVALTKLGEFDPATSFVAWVGQIVRFLALNEQRKRQRQREAHVDPDLIQSVAPRPLARKTGTGPVTSDGSLKAQQAAFDDSMAEAIAALEEPQRACLLLRVVNGLSYKDIAQALSMPEGTAMSHVHRARRILRERLSEPEGKGETR